MDTKNQQNSPSAIDTEGLAGEDLPDLPGGFYTLKTNAQTLDDCTVIIAGEAHGTYDKINRDGSPHWQWGESRHRIWNLFQRFGRKGDLHYRESLGRGEANSRLGAYRDYRTPLGMKTLGWDDMALVHEQRDIRFRQLPDARRRALKNGIQFEYSQEIRDLELRQDQIARERDLHLVSTLQEAIPSLQPEQRLILTVGNEHLNHHKLIESLESILDEVNYAIIIAEGN